MCVCKHNAKECDPRDKAACQMREERNYSINGRRHSAEELRTVLSEPDVAGNRTFVVRDGLLVEAQEMYANTGIGVVVDKPLPTGASTERQASANPKDSIGRQKVAMELIPPAAKLHMACAFMDGAKKYGAYNWRGNAVSAMVYIGALMRHIDAFLDGEDCAPDSLVQHLGHVQACAGIILDAAATGNLIDDRPTKGAASRLQAELHKKNVAKNSGAV